MKILFELDRDEVIEPNDPLGDIRIGDGQNLLSVKSTYLDSWFDVLIDGYKSLKNHKKITLEIIEEPEVITFEPVLRGFKISYGKKELFFSDLNEFYQSLLTSTEDFQSQLEQEGENLSELPIFIKISHFIEQSTIKQKQDSINVASSPSLQSQ